MEKTGLMDHPNCPYQVQPQDVPVSMAKEVDRPKFDLTDHSTGMTQISLFDCQFWNFKQHFKAKT